MLIQKSIPKSHKPQHYHGHTIIELRNARTGIRDRVESDNEFTLGIDQYLTDGGFFNNSPFANETWRGQPIYRNLIGGIFLFDSVINEVDGELPTIMPAGTKMIANGSYGVTNNASPTELGSYNSNESSFTSSGLTFVYDWTTSQGNGTIECVSLTSDTGGFIGYGNSVSNVRGSTRSLFLNQSNVYINDGSNSMGNFLKDNCRYTVTALTRTSFTYAKKRTPIDKVSLFPLSETHTVNFPAAMTAVQRDYVSAGRDGKFYFVPGNFIAAGTTYVMGIYDVDTDTWSTVNFTPASAHNYISGEYASVCDDFIYFWYGTAWNDRGLRINFDGTVEDAYYGVTCAQMGEDLLLCFSYNRYDTYPTFVVDLSNGTSYPSNGIIPQNSKKLKVLDKNRIEVNYNAGSGMNYFYLYRNPLYLATINNLDEPVTKTTTQTMKVTYTVTPA